MTDYLWRRCLRDFHHVIQWNHGAAVGPYVVIPNVSGLASKLLISLNVNTVGAVVEVEVVHISGTHVNLKRIRDLLKLDLQAPGLFAIDGDYKLWIVRCK